MAEVSACPHMLGLKWLPLAAGLFGGGEKRHLSVPTYNW